MTLFISLIVALFILWYIGSYFLEFVKTKLIYAENKFVRGFFWFVIILISIICIASAIASFGLSLWFVGAFIYVLLGGK